MEFFDKAVLRCYLQGNCSEEENARIRNYLQTNGPEMLLQLLDEDWEHAQGAMSKQDTEQLLANIRSSIQQHSTAGAVPVIKFVPWKRIAVAAAVLTIALTGMLFWFNGTQGNKVHAAVQSWHTIQNTQHNKINISLPDHSQVWLAVGSTLQYAADFGQVDRRVQLSGEAFFEVAKDSLHPFIVRAGKVDTRVLGTHFNVEAYEKESFTRISLVEGKVDATYTGAGNEAVSTALLPGSRLCYNRKAAIGKVEPISLHEDAYTGSAIVLQDISLNTALRRIGMHYGKSIHLQDSIDDRQQFSAVVPGNNLEEALGNIAFVYRLQYQVGKDTIRIYRN